MKTKTPKSEVILPKMHFLTLHPKIHIPHFEDKEGNKKFYAEINEPFAMRFLTVPQVGKNDYIDIFWLLEDNKRWSTVHSKPSPVTELK